ncbi:MAG: glycerol-3-phosphate acyltransferase [Clostridia bacterium]|nr:glycerol-3-phosphate acyltransferase [Clostridia bacterium]
MIYALAANGADTVRVFRSLSVLLSQALGNNETAIAIVNLVAALLCMILPYLLGSVNPAILISRHHYRVDIRTHGNGHADGANMLMAHGRGMGLLVLTCDVLKAVLASFLGLALWGFNGRALAGFFVLFGHMFPIFHRFVGGKGVALWSVTVFLLDPITFLILVAILAIGAVGTRMFAFGALLAAIMYPLILQAFYTNADLSVAMAVLTTVFYFFAYRANIKRILSAQEEKFKLSEVWGRIKGRSYDK